MESLKTEPASPNNTSGELLPEEEADVLEVELPKVKPQPKLKGISATLFRNNHH